MSIICCHVYTFLLILHYNYPWGKVNLRLASLASCVFGIRVAGGAALGEIEGSTEVPPSHLPPTGLANFETTRQAAKLFKLFYVISIKGVVRIPIFDLASAITVIALALHIFVITNTSAITQVASFKRQAIEVRLALLGVYLNTPAFQRLF